MSLSPIKIEDVIYGEITITNPLAIQIANSRPMQRLKGIDMAGYSAGFYPGCRHSRFEHSIGVYHLLSAHHARLEECVHGLLHDVSHTVFSHAVDYALDDTSGKNQDFQDRVFHNFVWDTEIPKILEDFGMEPHFIFDENNFPLQETTIPELCADRLDYAFRGFYHYKTLPLSDIRNLASKLRSSGTEWFFATKVAAQVFASAFAEIDDRIYDSLKGAAMLKSIGDCVEYALENKILTSADLFATDDEALAKLKSNVEKHPPLNKLWGRMNGLIPYKDDKDDYEAIVHCKSRIVDPKFVAEDGSLESLTMVSPQWKIAVEEGLKYKTYHLKFLD